MSSSKDYDAIIIGAGVSGAVIAEKLVDKGLKCLILEAGKFYYSETFPTSEIDGNSQMYWNGGVELTSDAELTLLRPKVVGGGSVINQCLLDRFDDNALESFANETGVKDFKLNTLKPWYENIEKDITVNEIPEEYANQNGQVFKNGFEANGFKCAPLERGQTDCQYESGMNCIECLHGCRINSKQSTLITFVRRALKKGLKIFSEFEVGQIIPGSMIRVWGKDKFGSKHMFKAKNLILASGAIGNTKLLINSSFSNKNIGKYFYTHPQYMLLGLFDKKIEAFKGPLQSYRSADPNFRLKGFKLENVFAPPVAISMLIKGFGFEHINKMRKISQLASIEVAIRDTNPGTIKVGRNNRTIVHKTLNDEDKKRKNLGYDAIKNIMYSQGAKSVLEGEFGIGLHLMGGCRMGVSGDNSVVNPDFQLHGYSNIYCADSSIFPNAPGINPSLTIMALSRKAVEKINV